MAVDTTQALALLRAFRRNAGDWPTEADLAELLGGDVTEIVSELKARHLVLPDAHGARIVLSSLGFAFLKARTPNQTQAQHSEGPHREHAR